MFDFTTELATLGPIRTEAKLLFAAVAGKQAEIDRFLGVLTGSERLDAYMTPSNLRRLIGVRGMAKFVLSRVRGQRSRVAA
jgi:hypothetical protein